MGKNLVISTVSNTSLHHLWTPSHNYDSFLIYYDEGTGYKGQSTFYQRAKGYKYHLIKDAVENLPNLFEYDYIWLPDDDIATNSEDICSLFEYMEEYKLHLAQPSIMGYYGVDITLHQKGSKIRFTNWVEIMCPCFSLKALLECKQSFKENNCGWAIERIWNRLLGHPKNKIAIIDDVIVIHTRPVLTGDTYKGKENPLEFALSEVDFLFKKWNLHEDENIDLLKGKPINGEICGAVVYNQIFKEMENGIKKEERVWPNANLIEHLVKSYII